MLTEKRGRRRLKTLMALFSEREQLKAMEDTVKETLRKNGLSRVRVSVTGSVSHPQIKLDGDEADVKRAQKLLTS
jgi:hypothetical protein